MNNNTTFTSYIGELSGSVHFKHKTVNMGGKNLE